MENKSHTLAAGAFVLFVTAIVIALATWLARDTTIRDVYEISSHESVTGLSPQSAVRYRGIPVGKVDAIEFDKQTKGNVLIRLAIDGNAPLTKSTFATLGFQGVTGLAYVQLDDQGDSKEPLETSRFNPTRIPLHPSLFSSLSDQGVKLVMQVEETSKQLNLLLSAENQKIFVGALQAAGQSATQIGAMSTRIQAIADAQLGPQRTNIPALVKDTGETMRALQVTAAELNKTTQEVGRTAQEAARTAQETTRAVQAASQAATSAASAAANAATAAAASVTALGNKVTEKGGVLDQVSQGSAALASSAQTLNASTLPRAARAVDDAAKAARNVDRVVNALGDNPQSLLYGNGTPTPGPGESGFTAPAATR
jgi:phospholipid/cholesterol/gamma-HCH transport system substrate-binding protein